MNLYGCGIKSANIFESTIKEKLGNKLNKIISLRGFDCSSENIIKSIQEIIKDCNKAIIYIFCHGDHRITNNHMIEYWEPPSGQHIDQIKIAGYFNELSNNSMVILFSESCSSEHLINKIAMKKRYLSIGSTQDNEDSIVTCDGGLFSLALIETIKEINHNCNINDFINHLMTKSVEIEHFSPLYSDKEILDEFIFKTMF